MRSCSISHPSSRALSRRCRILWQSTSPSPAVSGHTVTSAVSCPSRRAALTCSNPSITTSRGPSKTTTTYGASPRLALAKAPSSWRRRRATSAAYLRSSCPISACMVSPTRWAPQPPLASPARDTLSQVFRLNPLPVRPGAFSLARDIAPFLSHLSQAFGLKPAQEAIHSLQAGA